MPKQSLAAVPQPSLAERWAFVLAAVALGSLLGACSGSTDASALEAGVAGDAAADPADAAPRPDAIALDGGTSPDAAPAPDAAALADADVPEDAAAPADAARPDAASGYPTIDFDSPGTTYTLTGFGGAEDAVVIVDPDDASNHIVRVLKSATAATWAGTTVSTLPGDSIPRLPFDAASTRMRVRVFTPAARTVVRLKVEDARDPTITCETEATTTVGGGWETLTFDFAREAPGTARLDVARRFDRVSIFFAFGRDGASGGAGTYHFDDLAFVGGTSSPADAGVAEDAGPAPGDAGTSVTYPPLDFDTAGVTYTLTGFGGAETSTVIVDPRDATNHIGRVLKSGTAELWAGATVSTLPNNSIARLPISATRTRMSIRVWSPRAGIQVRLKVEDATDPTHSVETEASVTTANAWQTLTFDFASPANGTAALNPAYRFDRLSVFFDFGVTGAMAGAQTYDFDDVTMLP